MPLYEFRCLHCDEHFEFLSMHKNDQIELRCPNCESAEFERVPSIASHYIGRHSSTKQGAHVRTRACPSGTCATFDIPGCSR